MWVARPATTPRSAARRHPRRVRIISDAPPTRAVVGDDARADATSHASASSSDAGGSNGEAPRRPGRAARARMRRERAARLASAAADEDSREFPYKLFLGGVAANADPESIAAAFGGPSVARDVFVHGGRGFAFVSFADERSYLEALDVPPETDLFAEVRAAAAADDGLSPAGTDTNDKKKTRRVSLDDARRATFAVQCQESHADRLEAYLRDSLDAHALGVEVIGVAAPNEPPREGRRLTERVVLCRATPSDASSSAYGHSYGHLDVIRRVRADPALAMHRDFFPRVYDLRDSAVFASLAAASREVVDLVASDREAAGGDDGVKTRLETFPPSVARSNELAAAAAAVPAVKNAFTPRLSDATRVATVVSLRGDVTIVAYGGAERAAATDRDARSESRSTKARDENASRAYLKLAECALRHASLRDALANKGSRIRAVDVGAAPGGWTQFLARKGCRVVAIDPADVPDVPSGCRHLKDTAQNAWVTLRNETRTAAGSADAAAWCPFDVYVSDAVLHDADAQQNLLRGAVDAGLLRENAVIVVTFKSAPGRGVGEGYHRAAFARARKLGDELCEGDWTLTHLFANRSRERTFVGRLRSSRDARVF